MRRSRTYDTARHPARCSGASRLVARGPAAALALLAGLGLTLPLAAAERWFLMSRHGECADVAALKRKVPDLGDIADPDAFAGFMRRKGYDVTSTPVAVAKGKAREVNVPQKELSLVFVTAEMCRGGSAR